MNPNRGKPTFDVFVGNLPLTADEVRVLCVDDSVLFMHNMSEILAFLCRGRASDVKLCSLAKNLLLLLLGNISTYKLPEIR